MRRQGTETRERFPYERAPTDAQKGRRKQGENEREDFKISSLFLSSLPIFIFFSAFSQ